MGRRTNVESDGCSVGSTSRGPRCGASVDVLVLAKLWLVGGQRLTAYGSLTIDDQWFVQRASWISAGHWFGPFDAHTLIKQPGYPMFIAAMHAVRMPLLLAHQLALRVRDCDR